jgi:membrane dipeptidase
MRESHRAVQSSGILVDLAHGTPETVQAAVRVSTRPIIVSHTDLDTRGGSNLKMAEMMRSHLISKEHAKAVADAGCVIGVRAKLADTPKDFVENSDGGWKRVHGLAIEALSEETRSNS